MQFLLHEDFGCFLIKAPSKSGLWSVVMKEVISLVTFDDRYISGQAGSIRKKSLFL